MAPLDATVTQALSSYESTHSLPRGWLSFAATHAGDGSPTSLSHSSLSTALQSSSLWSSFTNPQSPLSQSATTNRTMLGDASSLKAEKASSAPTDQDRGANSSGPASSTPSTSPPDSRAKSGAEMRDQSQTETKAASSGGDGPQKKNWGPPNDPPPGTKMQQKSLKQAAKENVTQLGDPISLKAETADSNPTPDDAGAGGGKGARVTETPEETKEGGSGGAGTGAKAAGRKGAMEGPPKVDVDEVWGVVEKARGGEGNKAKM